MAALASASILIDAVNPGGQLRNSHTKALYDLRALQYRVQNEWRVACLRSGNSDNEAAVQVRTQIAEDLRAAETMFAASVDRRGR